MTEPMYRQIATDLQHRIESGELPQGAQLPTELELREQYDASRNTVRDAIKRLTNRGLVETRPGQGTYVVEKINPFVTTLTGDPEAEETDVYIAAVEKSGRKPTSSEPRVGIRQADAMLADALRIEEGAPIVSRQQQRFIDGTPWSRQTTYYPKSLADRGAEKLLVATDISGGTVAYLARECGIKQDSYRDSIAVRPPDDAEAAFFKLPADGRVSVFEIFRVGFDQNGERFRLTITVYPSDRNRFMVNVGPVPTKSERQPAAGPNDPNTNSETADVDPLAE
jgi:GntR family transcriptional regulator